MRSSIITQEQTATDFTHKIHPFINKSPNVGVTELRLKAKKPLLPLPRKRSLFDTTTNIKFSPKRESPKVKKTMTQSNFAMKKRSANVLGAEMQDRKLSSIDGGPVRHNLNLDSKQSTGSKFNVPSTASYTASNSSYLLGQSTAFGGGKPNI